MTIDSQEHDKNQELELESELESELTNTSLMRIGYLRGFRF